MRKEVSLLIKNNISQKGICYPDNRLFYAKEIQSTMNYTHTHVIMYQCIQKDIQGRVGQWNVKEERINFSPSNFHPKK